MTDPISVEHMCRDLLRIAIQEGSVRHPNNIYNSPGSSAFEPPHWPTGQLCGMANLLQSYLQNETDDEPLTLEWLAEVAPLLLVVEDDEPGKYAKKRGIEVGGSSCCYLLCGRKRAGKEWVPSLPIELKYIVPADFNSEGSTSLDHVETRGQFRDLIRLLAPDFKVGT